MIDLYGIILFEVSVNQDGEPKPPMLHLPIFKLARNQHKELVWTYTSTHLGGWQGVMPSQENTFLALAKEKGYFLLDKIRVATRKDFSTYTFKTTIPFKESDIGNV